MPKTRFAALAVAFATAGILAACGGGAAAGDAGADDPAQTTIRYQSYAAQVDTLEIADALGYLAPIRIEYVGDVQGGPESLRSLATDQVDIGAAFNGALAKAVATGVPIKGVVGYYGSNKKGVHQSLAVLEDSPIKGPKDLIGKKVALNTLGANYEAILDTYLREGGLTDDEIAKVTLVPLPPISTEGALRQGQVDAAYLGGAPRVTAFERGGLRSVVNDVDVVGEYAAGSLALRNSFIEEKPETAKHLVAALAKSAEYIRSSPRDEVIATASAYASSHGRPEASAALKTWPGSGLPREGGQLQDDDFARWIDWLVAEGEITKESIKVDAIYTNEFNPYATDTTS